MGLLGTAPSQDALAGCDTLLIAGSTFPYIEYYPKPGKARAVQIDLDPMRIGAALPRRMSAWSGIPADAAAPCSRCCGATRTGASSKRRKRA